MGGTLTYFGIAIRQLLRFLTKRTEKQHSPGLDFQSCPCRCANRTRGLDTHPAIAVSQSLHPRASGGECLRFRGHRALFLHGEQAKELSLPSMGRTDAQKRPNRRQTHGVSVGGLAVNG